MDSLSVFMDPDDLAEATSEGKVVADIASSNDALGKSYPAGVKAVSVSGELIYASCDSPDRGREWIVFFRNIRQNAFLERARLVTAAMQRARALAWAGAAAALSYRADEAGDAGDEGDTMAALSVQLLIIDCMSSGSFLRTMPLTAAFLESLKSHTTFEFRRFNTVGMNSLPNQSVIFSGFTFNYDVAGDANWKTDFAGVDPSTKRWYWKKNRGKPRRSSHRQGSSQSQGGAAGQRGEGGGQLSTALNDLASPDTWIWQYYKSLGYVTLFGSELCNTAYTGEVRQQVSGVERFFHRNAEPADHVASAPFCPLKVKNNMVFSPVSSKMSQRCISDRPSWQLAMEYLDQFERNYEEVGRFSSFTMMAGHEPTQHVVKLLDRDLRDYLRRRLSNPNSIVFLLGDHGLHYGPFSQTQRGQLEAKLPVLRLVLPNALLRRHPHLADTLRGNRDTLVSAYDLYATLKHIPVYPDPPVRIPPWSYSLFWKIPRDRTCQDAGIGINDCTCSQWQPLPLDEPNVDRAATLATYFLNEMVGHARRTSPASSPSMSCSVVGLRRVVHAEGLTQRGYIVGDREGVDDNSMAFGGQTSMHFRRIQVRPYPFGSFLPSPLFLPSHDPGWPRLFVGQRSPVQQTAKLTLEFRCCALVPSPTLPAPRLAPPPPPLPKVRRGVDLRKGRTL